MREKEQIQTDVDYEQLEAILVEDCHVPFPKKKGELNEIIKKNYTTLKNCIDNIPDADFIFLYCKMRSLTELYYNNNKIILRNYTSEQFFYVLEESAKKGNCNFAYKHPNISFTILACIGIHQYKEKKDSTQEIPFELGIHSAFKCSKCLLKCSACISISCIYLPEDCPRRMLEEFFLLHQALKTERNCNNHAFEHDVRLSKEIVDHAIKIYIKRFRELQAIIDSADTPS